jgi:hypothetical protein
MSLPHCDECDGKVERAEMRICEQCERIFCVECLQVHGCALDAARELEIACPERTQGGSR